MSCRADFELEMSGGGGRGRHLACRQQWRILPWQARIGVAQSRAQSSSSGHTFLLYLCSKLDLRLLLSAAGNSLSEGPSLSLSSSPALSAIFPACLFLTPSPLPTPPPTPPSCPHFLSLPWSGGTDTEQKRLMVIKIRKREMSEGS